jgi:hypothetical protein
MARRSALFWAVVVVLVLGAALYLPAYVARSATAVGEPVDFMTQPVEGWRFLWEAVRTVPDARAGTPEEARRLAIATFADARVQPLKVELLWLPGRQLTLQTKTRSGQGTRALMTNARLVWKVAGRTRPDGPIETVGLIDLATGTVIYDARNDRSKLAS